ncbi:MAG: hypothetical protein JSS75_11065 [Bacteroidetes bacterium]|nr:hypothetical protein [Bacteroidota bacterium]
MNENIKARSDDRHRAANKLFLACPFCQLERLLERNLGEGYFLSVPAGILDLEEQGFQEQLEYLLLQEGITDIYLVFEPSCSIIEDAAAHHHPNSAQVHSIRDLLAEAREPIAAGLKVLRDQMERLIARPILQAHVNSNTLRIHRVITYKHEESVLEVM